MGVFFLTGVVGSGLCVFVGEFLLDGDELVEGLRGGHHGVSLCGGPDLAHVLVVFAAAFGEHDFEEVGLADVDFANHPACAAALPNFFLDLLGPPPAFCADESDVSETSVFVGAAEGVAQDVLDVGHEGVDLLFFGRKQVGARDDEADFCDAVVGYPSLVLCSAVLGS